MDANYRSMIDFLRGLGTEDVPYSGDKGFLAHRIGVFRDLEAWNCDRDLCRAACQVESGDGQEPADVLCRSVSMRSGHRPFHLVHEVASSAQPVGITETTATAIAVALRRRSF